MNNLTPLYHILRADFLERTRRYSFLITLGLAIFIAYSFLPATDAKYVALELGGYRGLYNSAYVGNSAAVMTSVFLSLAGFYLVKNTIERDQQTGVGQIIATTPLRKIAYLLGKAASNFAVLALITGIVLVSAGAMQFVRGEDLRLDLAALIAPFLVITLPAMLVVSALAVLFETLPLLRGGLGNVVYFFTWLGLIGVVGAAIIFKVGSISALLDPLGVALPMLNMLSVTNKLPENNGNVNIGPYPLEGEPLKTFRWEGMQWTVGIVLMRLVWLLVALAIIFLAAGFFDRFTSSQEIPAGKPASRKPRSSSKVAQGAERLPLTAHLSTVPAGAHHFRFIQSFWVELRLLLKGQRWWWYAGAAGMMIVGLASSVEAARQVWLPAAWIWPILIWSGLGTREQRHLTGQFVFSAPHPLSRQLPVAWLSGFSVALLAGSGVALNLLRTGDWPSLGAWLAGALFIPSLALALGIWSGSSKLFEALYVALWYVGPLHPLEMPWFDFMGAANSAVVSGMPLIYLALALFLSGLAVAGRWRQVTS